MDIRLQTHATKHKQRNKITKHHKKQKGFSVPGHSFFGPGFFIEPKDKVHNEAQNIE